MRTAGNGVTFAEGREDNTVTPDQSRSEQNQTLSGRLSISFLLHNTADTLYQSSSAFSSRPSAETAPSREGPRALGLHGTSIWQVSTHTSPLREAAWVPSRSWSGEHTRVAAWLAGDIYVLWIV